MTPVSPAQAAGGKVEEGPAGRRTYWKGEFCLDHVYEGFQTSRQNEESRKQSRPRKKPKETIDQPEQEEAYQSDQPGEGWVSKGDNTKRGQDSAGAQETVH